MLVIRGVIFVILTLYRVWKKSVDVRSRVGVVQMNSSDNFEANLRFAETQLQQAAELGLDLVAFPETFLYVGKSNVDKHQIAQTLDDELVSRFRELATVHNISVLLGSIYEKIVDDGQRLFNTSVLINRQGEISAAYRKLYLCDAPNLGHLESTGIRPGEKAVVVDHEIGRVGLSICYDLRFPELYRELSAQGAEIIFVPAAFFLYTGKHHWLPLLIARAIENQVYIVAPNQWGFHYEGRISFGSSVIIDPWGSILCCAPEQPGLSWTAIDLDYLHQVRNNMPIHTHRRPELYRQS